MKRIQDLDGTILELKDQDAKELIEQLCKEAKEFETQLLTEAKDHILRAIELLRRYDYSGPAQDLEHALTKLD